MPHRNVPYPSPTKQPPAASRSLSNGSPSRPLESQLDVLYNTAVQAFVRRDHVKTQENLSRVMELLKTQPKRGNRAWYEVTHLSNDKANGSNGYQSATERDEWTIKTLKLLITSHISVYTDPPTSTSSLPSEIIALLPPFQPDRLLAHVYQTCLQHVDSLLPPQLVSTFILASLKLRPAEPALSWTHHLTEDWLAQLPDSFIQTISARNKAKDPANQRKQIEALREAYLKVVELFVGEVLAREGEWEMARGLLDGESVMPSKRKEELYKHLRNIQARKSNPSSPSTSGILPSPSSSGILPRQTSPSPSRSKGRSLSTSSSSSERTARPANGPLNATSRSAPFVDRKGKGRATSTTASTESVPRHIEVNHTPVKPSARSVGRMTKSIQELLNGALDLLPSSMRNRLQSASFLRMIGVSAGIPFVLLALMVFILRRRRRKLETAVGAVVPASGGIANVRARLALARQRGLLQWIRYWLRWWAEKFKGVWQLGTSITYF